MATRLAGAATIEKTNNADALNLPSSWVGGVVPGSSDVALWSATVAGTNSVALGADASWAGLRITNVGGPVLVNGAHTLTVGASGLDLFGAAQNLTLNCPVTLGAGQAWPVSSGRTLTLNGPISGGGLTLAKNGTGTLLLSNSTPLATLDVNAGVVRLAGGTLTTSGGSGAYGYLVVSGGATFEQTGGSFSSPVYICVGQSGSGSTLDLRGGTVNVGADLLIGYAANGILNVSGTANVTAGTLRFGQAASATINLNGGTLSVDAWNSPNGGTLHLNGGRFRYAGGGGDNWNAANVTAYVSTNGAWLDTPEALTIGQPLLHLPALGALADGGLRKSGGGTLTLTASNSYTGPTVVSNGTLVVNGRLNGTSSVTVNSGARLDGTGNISGPVVVRDGGTLAAGPSPFTLAGLALSNTTVLDLSLGSANSGTNAAVRVNGNLVLDGQWLVSDAGGLATGQSYAAIYYTGTLTNRGVTLHALSGWDVTVDTNTPRVVKLAVVRKFPFIEFTNAPVVVTTLQTNLSVILHGTTTKAMWYEVRDATNRLWDYGAHAPSSPWSFSVRHLREGTNRVTVFAQPGAGGIASNTTELVLNLGPNTPVRPRPVPAEIWWGGSCHDNLYNTNGDIIGTFSRLAQLTNTAGWDFVKRWQDGFMLHGYVWVNSVAKMTNRAVVGPAISAQLNPLRTRFILEDAWRPRTNDMNYGNSSAGGQSGNAGTLEGLGFTLSDVTQDYNPMYRDFSEWHPEWPTNDLRVAGTGNLNQRSAGYPFASGQWRDFVAGYRSLRPHVKTGWTWSPVWFSWLNGPSLGGDHGNFSFARNGTNYTFAWDFFDFMSDGAVVGDAAGSPFSFMSDCPWDYFGEYPGNPGGWSQSHQFNNRKKMRDYEAWLWARGLNHTLICNSSDSGSAANANAYDFTYKTNSLRSIFLHQLEGGRARRYMFESWYQGPFTMLPETTDGTYASLARDAIRFLKGMADTNGTLEPLRLFTTNNGTVVTVTLRNDGTYRCLPVLQAFIDGGGTLFLTNGSGANITAAALSAEGFVHTNFLNPGQSTTFTLSVTGAPLASTVTLEAFWNPQDPTGLVRDRAALTLPALVGPATLAASNGLWRYHDGGLNLGTSWRSNSFNDTAWKVGWAELGFGDGGEATLIARTNGAGTTNMTFYFRQSFYVPDAALVQNLTARMVRDDGAVVYLNGAEVWRDNMPTGTVSHATTALTAIAGTAEATWLSRALGASNLFSGWNVIAAEIHQNTNSSSDVSFNFALDATSLTRNTPALANFPSGFGWPASNGIFSLMAATNLTPPVAWQRATNVPALSNGVWRVWLPDEGLQKFFRLQTP